ncbi:MAG: PD-(D/E)XK nuclease family protein [Pseudanabaenaceae cyanobacterium SKYGB_i_bin29]|nr:PD-(D/E)XK nuclease family protein [Pseudanabaenaceae cyanobacterium SKYG29]MDW8420251.1 PD-(D/E)XK nuclease family protein [Pseudanabaenaceae cyanobacterium SKYGB_i_bin29]
MIDPRSLCLSASSLDIYTLCPRKFFYIYLAPDKLRISLEDHGRRGTQFHRLVAILTHLTPAERQPWLDRVDPKVRSWWENFRRAGLDQAKGKVYSEFPVHWQYRGWKLQAKYDRLVITATGYEIWDWKTGKETISWQHSLYPLLWHWYKDVAPESISLHFWYAQDGKTISFPYNQQRKEADQGKLDRVLDQLEDQQFPPTTDSKNCLDCFFRYHCWGKADIRNPASY